VQQYNRGGLAANSFLRPILHITHSVTADSADGQPWPPPDDTVLWAVVRRANSLTLWRSIKILPSDPPPADVHDHLGGPFCTER
jgi:hypothetical protein